MPPIVLTTISPAEGGTTPPSPSPQTTLPPVEYPPQTPETLTFGSSLITTQNETAEVIIGKSIAENLPATDSNPETYLNELFLH